MTDSAPGSAAPVVPLTPAIRRQLLIDAAKEMLAAEPFGPVMTPVVVRLAALGVGEVQSVDFEEQIITVLSLDADGFPATEAWRIENVYEAVQS